MKKTIRSKTIWFNVLMTIISSVSLLSPLLETLVEDIVVRGKILAIILFVSGVLNIVLRRFFTEQPIGK